MVKSILIGVDDTRSSARAVQMGIRWAQQSNAMLVGLAVVDETELCLPEAVPLGAGASKKEYDCQRIHAAYREAEQRLERFAEQCADAKVACKLLEDTGLPPSQIEREAQRYDLVMLGNRLKFQYANDFEEFGALREVLKCCPRPVIVVPEHPCQGETVLVAYDGSVQAARSLQAFLAADLPVPGEIHVVSVCSDQVEAARRGDRAVEYLSSHSRTAQLHAIKATEPVAAILMQEAAKLDAGLIVMGCFGRSVIKEFVFGSVTKTLLRDSVVPMLLSH